MKNEESCEISHEVPAEFWWMERDAEKLLKGMTR
jgi:hypothetical protein